MNRIRAAALAWLGVVVAVAAFSLVDGTPSLAVIEIGASVVGLMGLGMTGVAAVQRLGTRLAPAQSRSGLRESSVLAVSGFLVALVAMVLYAAVEISYATSVLPVLPAAWFISGPPLAYAGYALEAMAVFAAVRELPHRGLRRSVPSRPSPSQERVRRLVLAGAPLFVMGALVAFIPIYRTWGFPYRSGAALFSGWQDAIFPNRIPGILAWLAGSVLLVLAGLVALHDAKREVPTSRRRTVQVLLVAALVLSTGFTAEIIASTPPAYLVLIPAGRVLHIESSGGDPLAYIFNTTTTTGHVTGAWWSNQSIMSAFLNGYTPSDTRGECPPPSPPTYGPLAMNGTIDEYFPPVWRAELTWFCVVPPATITITSAVVVSYT